MLTAFDAYVTCSPPTPAMMHAVLLKNVCSWNAAAIQQYANYTTGFPR